MSNLLIRGQIESKNKEGCSNCEVLLYDMLGVRNTKKDVQPNDLIH